MPMICREAFRLRILWDGGDEVKVVVPETGLVIDSRPVGKRTHLEAAKVIGELEAEMDQAANAMGAAR